MNNGEGRANNDPPPSAHQPAGGFNSHARAFMLLPQALSCSLILLPAECAYSNTLPGVKIPVGGYFVFRMPLGAGSSLVERIKNEYIIWSSRTSS